MAKLMPPDGEQLQWVDEGAYYRYVPESEDDDGHGDDLSTSPHRIIIERVVPAQETELGMNAQRTEQQSVNHSGFRHEEVNKKRSANVSRS
jgi:hypothetical protein